MRKATGMNNGSLRKLSALATALDHVLRRSRNDSPLSKT